jgi:hypothetical protein
VLLCALAFVLGAEAVAAKCRNPLRVDGVVAAAVVFDGVLREVPFGQIAPLLEEIGPDDIHSVLIRCWAESTAPNARGLSLIVVLTKDYVASLGDATADEAVAAALAKVDPDIEAYWKRLTAES